MRGEEGRANGGVDTFFSCPFLNEKEKSKKKKKRKFNSNELKCNIESIPVLPSSTSRAAFGVSRLRKQIE